VTLYARRGLDWTHRFGKGLPVVLLQLPVKTAIVDGKVVVEDADGLPSFAALRDALSIGGKGQYVFMPSISSTLTAAIFASCR
jgi:bifunctional non-homologous end joining protein LigD